MSKLIILFFLFFFGCSDADKVTREEKTGIIAEISEASGICYVEKTDTLFVVGDDGKIYEMQTNGTILKEKKIATDDNDFEGITYHESEDLLLIAVEGVDNILIIDRKSLTSKRDVNIKRGDILTKDKKNGLEGITIIDEEIYLSNQSNPAVIIQIDSIDQNQAEILEIYNHSYENIAGLASSGGFLYMLSDHSNEIIKYDIRQNETLTVSKLLKGSWEGIAFDKNGYIYLADDSKGKIFKYKKSKFNL